MALVWLGVASVVCAATPRVAVIDRTADRAAGDLVAAACTQRGGVELVERARLDEVMAERSLQTLTPATQQEIGRLLKADGLLILGQEGSLLTARLVETQRGQIMDLVAANVGEGTPAQATDEIARHLAAAAGKLATPAGKRLYLALMPFGAESPELERSGLLPTLNLLTGVHLLERPELFLVEREALADVQNESELSVDTRQRIEAADLVARAQATVQDDGRLLVRVRLTRNERAPGEPVFLEATIDPGQLSTGVAGLVERMAAAMTGVGPSPTRDLRGEAPSFYALGAYHAARSRNRDALRFLESACALDPQQKIYSEMLLNLQAVIAGGLYKSSTNAAALAQRLDLLWRAVCIAETTDSRFFSAETPDAAMLIAALAAADKPGVAAESVRQAARIRALLRDHLRRMVGPPRMLAHRFAHAAYADAQDVWFAAVVAQIEKSGFNWFRCSDYVFAGVVPRERWRSYLEELKATEPDRKPQAFAEMGLLQLANRSPAAMARMLDWLLENPVERCADIEFDGSLHDELFCHLIATRPKSELGSLLQRLIVEPFERNERFDPRVFGATGFWERQRKTALAQGRTEEADAIRTFQRNLLDALERAVAAKRRHSHWAGHTFEADRNELRALLAPQPPPATNAVPTTVKAGTGNSCPVLGDAGFPNARLLFDSRAEPTLGVEGARSLYDGERIWCVLSSGGRLLLHGFQPDGRSDPRLVLQPAERARAQPPADVPIHLALGREELFVADTRNVFRLAVKSAPTLIGTLPPLSAWPGVRADRTNSEPAITSLVTGPDALYIGVSDVASGAVPLPFLRAGSLYRWTPRMAAPERIASSEVVAAGPLNDCLPYAVENGVAHPDGGSVLFFLRGNVDDELLRATQPTADFAPPAAATVLRPTDPRAGQRAGVWKFVPETRTWTRLNSRFPYARLLRAWKVPAVATNFPATLFAQPRDPVEFNTVALRFAIPDQRGESDPERLVWPEFIDVPLEYGRYVLARTGPAGEAIDEVARMTVPRWHRWLDGGRTAEGALLPLLEVGRFRVWHFPIVGKETP